MWSLTYILSTIFTTISGTDEERGLLKWRKSSSADTASSDAARLHIYDLPIIQPALNKITFLRYIPCCPNFLRSRSVGGESDRRHENGGYDNPALANDNPSDTRL